MEAQVYKKDGKAAGKVTLPESVFDVKWNPDLVHQVVVSMQSNARSPIAHTKDRSEVSGTNQKPWRQKGTGRARHGQKISPIWRGGGIAFGPTKDKNFTKKINKKMRTKALYSVLSRKFKDGEIIFVEDLNFDAPKTKDAVETLKGIASADGVEMLSDKKKNAALIALPGHDENTAKSFRNMGNVLVDEVRNLNPVQLLTYKYLIVAKPDESIKVLENRAAAKTK